VPLTVKFTDRSYEYIYDYSVDVNDFHWDFGDGSTSRLEDPEHTYTTAGVYTVTLRIVDTDGYESTQIKSNFIAAGAPAVLEAEFYSSRRRGTQTTYVRFYNQSSGDISSWLWDFGDGETSTEQKPTHIYTVPGTYTVSLTVSGPGGSDTEIEENYIYNFFGESYTDNTFQHKPHFYSRGYSTFGKVICNTGEVKLQEEDLNYTRIFHGSCNSYQYFAETFCKGVMFANTKDVRLESYGETFYLEYYLKGYSDIEILNYVNDIENIHEYYNFNLRPPSMR
jgi:PKD repeat protein